MHLPSILLPLLAGLLPLTSASPPSEGTIVTFYVKPSSNVPNPRAALPASTHATLTTAGKATRTAYIDVLNGFVFRNVSAGSYLVDFHCRSHGFVPLRLDVRFPPGGEEGQEGVVKLEAWETFRGNDWDNKGEAIVLDERGFPARVAGMKGYYMERQGFSIFGILKNPMILLGLVSMGIFLGMPKLIENMDPAMRAEWEERQKGNPMNSIMGSGGGQQAPNPLGNFDMAAYLAGSSKKDEADGNGSKKGKR